MAKPSAFIQKLQANQKHNMNLQRLFTLQQSEDLAIITLGRHFGFGPKRAEEFRQEFRSLQEEYAKLCIDDAGGDSQIIYTKACMDRELERILGDDFHPWEERYPDTVFR